MTIHALFFFSLFSFSHGWLILPWTPLLLDVTLFFSWSWYSVCRCRFRCGVSVVIQVTEVAT